MAFQQQQTPSLPLFNIAMLSIKHNAHSAVSNTSFCILLAVDLIGFPYHRLDAYYPMSHHHAYDHHPVSYHRIAYYLFLLPTLPYVYKDF